MKSYVLLFRGINVGGNNIISMKELKLVLEGEGYKDVKTYIQSGNVVLKVKSNPAKRVASVVELSFGFKPDVWAIEETDFEKKISANPYTSYEGKFVHFYFCAKRPNLNVQKVESLIANDETFELKDNVFYLHAPNGIGRSKLVLNIEACLGVSYTGRNLNTVLKLRELLQNA